MSSTAAAHAQPVRLQIPESKSPLVISLTQPAEEDGFKALHIRIGDRTSTFHPRNPLVCAPKGKDERKNDMDWSEIKGMPFDPSFCFHRAQFGANQEHTLLAFMSHGYASDAGPTYVIGFQDDGTPYKVLERDELDLFAFEGNTDGAARLIGFPTLSQVISGDGGNGSTAPYATTYDPRAVYIVTPGLPAKYSLDESHAYNLKNYVWAGPLMSEKYAVVHNYPGHHKLFGVPAQQLEALFAKLPPQKSKP